MKELDAEPRRASKSPIELVRQTWVPGLAGHLLNSGTLSNLIALMDAISSL